MKPSSTGMNLTKLNGQRIGVLEALTKRALGKFLKEVSLCTPTAMYLTADSQIGTAGQAVEVFAWAKFPYSATNMAIALVKIGDFEEAETVVGVIPDYRLTNRPTLQTQATTTAVVAANTSQRTGLSSA